MGKKHSRHFLIFNNEDSGFEVSTDKEPTGYTKVEVKKDICKITVYAQNLKVEKGPYIGYLIDASKNPAIVARLGEIDLNESGKGEIVWEEDAKNIAGTGLSADKFNVAAVVREGNRLQAPLVGYYSKEKIKWREKINNRSFVKSESKEADIEDLVEDSGIEVQSDIPERNDDNDIIEDIIEIEEDIDKDKEEAIVDSYSSDFQRDDSDYIEEYSQEGMEFKHYEDEIYFKSNDKLYETLDNNKIEEPSEEVNEEYLYDARDINIEGKNGILYRVLKENKIDINNLSEEGLQRLNKGIEKELKNLVNREVRECKENIIKRISDNDNLEENVETFISTKSELSDDAESFSFNSMPEQSSKIENRKSYAKRFHEILNSYEEFSIKDLKDCRMWKIEDSAKMPQKDSEDYIYYSAILHLKMTYPYINYIKYFRECGHYYFGIKYDRNGEVKYLVYGIEGEKKESKQPYKGMTGFVTHVPFGRTGMWIMHYNPYTGCVMLPRKKSKK